MCLAVVCHGSRLFSDLVIYMKNISEIFGKNNLIKYHNSQNSLNYSPSKVLSLTVHANVIVILCSYVPEVTLLPLIEVIPTFDVVVIIPTLDVVVVIPTLDVVVVIPTFNVVVVIPTLDVVVVIPTFDVVVVIPSLNVVVVIPTLDVVVIIPTLDVVVVAAEILAVVIPVMVTILVKTLSLDIVGIKLLLNTSVAVRVLTPGGVVTFTSPASPLPKELVATTENV